jgi:type IV pilus assembly protein PilM
MGLFGGGGQRLVGLDVGASSVKIVSGIKKGKSFLVDKLVIVPLPYKAIDDRGISNHQAVLAAVESGIREVGGKGTPIATSVKGGGIITRRVTIPKIPMKDIPDQVKWEAQQVFPQDITQVLVDYVLLGEGKNVPGAPADTVGWELMLIGVREEEASSLMNLLESAKAQVKVMDLDVFVAGDFIEQQVGTSKSEPVAFVDVGASATRVSVRFKGQAVYVREFAIGGNTFTETMASVLGLSFENAEALKVQEDSGIPNEAVEPLQTLLVQWKSELLQCEDVFVTQTGLPPVSKFYVFGGGARTPGLFDILKDDRFNGRVVPLPAAEMLKPKGKHIDPGLLAMWSLRLITASGLCTRKG